MLANHFNPQIGPPCGNDVFIIFELTGKLGLGLRCQKGRCKESAPSQRARRVRVEETLVDTQSLPSRFPGCLSLSLLLLVVDGPQPFPAFSF